MDYQALQATASRLMQEHGQGMTLTSITPGTYDPATAISTPTQADQACRGILMDYGALDRVADTVIEQGDRKALIAARGLTAAPKPGDKLTVGSDSWRVVSVLPLDPAGVVVTYTLQVRK